MIRRLDRERDEELFREEESWQHPRWLRDCAEAWERTAPEEGRIYIGIFGEGLLAIVTVDLIGKGIFEGHINAKRHTPLELLLPELDAINRQLFQQGMSQGIVWLPVFNFAMMRLCLAVGFRPDGVKVLKGETHGRVIEWQRLVIP